MTTDKPYGEVLDDMDHQAKLQPATAIDFGAISEAVRLLIETANAAEANRKSATAKKRYSDALTWDAHEKLIRRALATLAPPAAVAAARKAFPEGD